MISRRITAVILCFAMVIGMAGCKDKSRDKDIADIEKLVSEYSQALKDYDLKALYRISTLEDDESFNWWLLPVMDEQKLIANNGEEKGKRYFEFFKSIASTIAVEYDVKKIEFSGERASLKVKYKIVFWDGIVKGEYNDKESLVKRIKEEKDVETYNDTIDFMIIDGQWKIVSTKSIRQLFNFTRYDLNAPRAGQ